MLKRREMKKIEDLVEEFFEKIGEELLSLSSEQEEETIRVNIRLDDPRRLIGERGEILRSIQRLLRIMALKNLDERVYLQLDINGYKEKKAQYLREMAQEIADSVSLSREEKSLTPMSSYERRIIHIELAERADVDTESTGREPERRVVVKPT